MKKKFCLIEKFSALKWCHSQASYLFFLAKKTANLKSAQHFKRVCEIFNDHFFTWNKAFSCNLYASFPRLNFDSNFDMVCAKYFFPDWIKKNEGNVNAFTTFLLLTGKLKSGVFIEWPGKGFELLLSKTNRTLTK